MPKLMGHLALALLFALPAWYVWEDRIPIAFAGFVMATSMLPDVDLLLRSVFPTVHHHGFTHTILFVTLVSVVAGLLAAPVVAPVLERWWLASEGETVSRKAIRWFVVGGLLLGGLSHLFGDMLSAPDLSQPIEPFWPFFDKPISVDVIYYSSIWWNLGLLIVAVVAHLVLAARDDLPLERYSKRLRA